MNKIDKFNKYFYTVIFSIISTFVFLIEFRAFERHYLTSDSSVVNFFSELFNSLKDFDIMYVILWIFIMYFYYNVYFDGTKYDKKCLISTIIAIIFTVLTIIGKSYYIDNTLNTIYSSLAQIFKTIILILGYYLLYYSVLKKIFNIKLDGENIKKKDLLLVNR